MDTSNFGVWAMIAFWASAIGGIVIGISWARARGGKPVESDLVIRSLKRRLESGEISKEQYDKKLSELQEPKP